MKRKILISPGYGAGWSTWAPADKQQKIAEYQPIIEWIENGGDPKKLHSRTTPHPLIVQMCKDLEIEYFYTSGASQLVVKEVDPPYLIEEYDGAEYLRTSEDFWT